MVPQESKTQSGPRFGLPQASHFKDRVFLNEITERKHVLDLLTGDISPGQIVRLPDMTSENGEMLKHLANDLDNWWYVTPGFRGNPGDHMITTQFT